jgi:hypothetical protein
MFMKACGLLTPMALGGVWMTGGFESMVVGTPEAPPVIHEALSETCLEVRKTHAIKTSGKATSAGDLAGGMNGTLSAVDQMADMENALRVAGCPTTFGPNGLVGTIGSQMREASDRMDEAAEEMEDAELASQDLTDPAIDPSE